ncbi:MAG: MotA/TolQ/ExbB proton channel family protein [Deltaproteobacteria bacterium]|nr:MotA/TolQ/ExbB proton channel family protein [Deltaproteobacteria bacterium]
MSFFLPDLIIRGGWLMYPISLCSILALAVFLERLFKLRRVRILPRDLMQDMNDLIIRYKYPDAISLCQGHPSPMARIYQAGLRSSGQPRQIIKEVVQEVGRREAAELEKYISILATIASITPLLGLLGTVSGMIKTFNIIAYYGVGNPGTMAGGISEALITTAAGLTVAIPTLVGYRFVSSKADNLILNLEEQSIKLVESLKGPEQ